MFGWYELIQGSAGIHIDSQLPPSGFWDAGGYNRWSTELWIRKSHSKTYLHAWLLAASWSEPLFPFLLVKTSTSCLIDLKNTPKSGMWSDSMETPERKVSVPRISLFNPDLGCWEHEGKGMRWEWSCSLLSCLQCALAVLGTHLGSLNAG